MRLGLILAWSTAAACVALQVHAQAIDPAAATATMGAPLDLLVHLRPAPELGAARFDRRCVHAEIRIGDRLLDNPALQVDLGQASDDGLTPVRLRHPRKVDEPIVQLHISLLCGASYSREFNVLAQEAPPALPVNIDVRKPARRPVARAAPARDERQPAVAAIAAVPTAERQTNPLVAPPAETSQASAFTSSVELQALARSVMKLLQAAGLPGHQAGNLPPVPETSTPDAIAQNNYLLQEVQRLRVEQQQASTALASLHARLARTEDDRWLQAGWMTLAALAGLIAFGLLARLGDAMIPLLARRWRLAREEPGSQGLRHRSTNRPMTGSGDLQDVLAVERPIQPSHEVRQPDTTDSPTARASAQQTIDFDTETTASTLSSDTPVGSSRMGTTGMADLTDDQLARAQRWSKASFGPASLDHNIVRPLRNDIDNAIALGYLGFAATMLEQTLYSGAGKHPWALMRLLDVYEALDQPDNHDRVCAEIEALYSVRPAAYRSSTRRESTDSLATAPSLLESLADWPALCAAWAHADAPALIETCLLRGKNRFDLDLPTFADLLFLHELAQIRDAGPLDPPSVATHTTAAAVQTEAISDHGR